MSANRRHCWNCSAPLEYGAALCHDCLAMIISGIIVGWILGYFD